MQTGVTSAVVSCYVSAMCGSGWQTTMHSLTKAACFGDQRSVINGPTAQFCHSRRTAAVIWVAVVHRCCCCRCDRKTRFPIVLLLIYWNTSRIHRWIMSCATPWAVPPAKDVSCCRDSAEVETRDMSLATCEVCACVKFIGRIPFLLQLQCQ